MYTAARHLELSQRYLHLARDNVAAGQNHRAADALRRAVTHAASSILVAEGRPTNTRRRLYNALGTWVYHGAIPHAHLTTFRRVHDLPTRLDAMPPDSADAARLLRTMRLRVRRLLNDVSALVNSSSIITLEEAVRFAANVSDPPQMDEIHATVPAHCNNLPFPPDHPPGVQLAYDPSICRNCANLPKRITDLISPPYTA